MSNLDLWNKYFKPHKDAMKKFKKGGGFGGTAIDPMWLIRSATEEWGPMGGAWGFKVLDSRVDCFGDKAVQTSLIEVWYPDGKIQSYGGTEFLGENKNGPFLDDESFKKSTTDALSKALSWLGFGAAVHMGMFDGNKYVDLRPTTQDKPQEPPEDNSLADEAFEDDAKEKAGLIKDVVEMFERLSNRLGVDECKKWHVQVMANYFGGRRKEDLTRKELDQLLYIQKEREKAIGGN